MLKLTTFVGNKSEITADVKLPNNIETIEFSYDGGRVGVSINGKSVFYSMHGDTDCEIVIDKNDLPHTE